MSLSWVGHGALPHRVLAALEHHVWVQPRASAMHVRRTWPRGTFNSQSSDEGASHKIAAGPAGSPQQTAVAQVTHTFHLFRRFLLEWLSFLHRYVPVGLLEVMPQAMNWRTVHYCGRNDLETLLARQVMFLMSQQLGNEGGRLCQQTAVVEQRMPRLPHFPASQHPAAVPDADGMLSAFSAATRPQTGSASQKCCWVPRLPNSHLPPSTRRQLMPSPRLRCPMKPSLKGSKRMAEGVMQPRSG